MRKIGFMLIPILILSLMSGCEKPKWYSFVYPNQLDLFKYNSNGPYETLEKCKQAATKELESIYAKDKGYYQCGINCADKDGVILITLCDDIKR